MAAAARNAGVLALFDVDGTLTAPRKVPFPGSVLLFCWGVKSLPAPRCFSEIIISCFSGTGGDAWDAWVHEAAAPGENWDRTSSYSLTLFWSQGELQCRFHLGSSMSPWAWWADPIWWRLPSSSAGQVWDVHTQLWPRSVVDRNCTLLLNLARRCWIGLVLFPFCSYYWLRLRLLWKWSCCTQERRANWNSSKSLGTTSMSCIQWRAQYQQI